MFRFGFGGQTSPTFNLPPHPGKERIMVLAVVGGVSYREIAQVQQNISYLQQQDPQMKIILVSNNIINAEDILMSVFR